MVNFRHCDLQDDEWSWLIKNESRAWSIEPSDVINCCTNNYSINYLACMHEPNWNLVLKDRNWKIRRLDNFVNEDLLWHVTKPRYQSMTDTQRIVRFQQIIYLSTFNVSIFIMIGKASTKHIYTHDLLSHWEQTHKITWRRTCWQR